MVQSPPSFGTAAELLARRRRVTSFIHVARAQRRGASRGFGDKNAERHLGHGPRAATTRPELTAVNAECAVDAGSRGRREAQDQEASATPFRRFNPLVVWCRND